MILSGVRWDFLWQRHHTLASRFARAGYPTVFVETTGLANPRLETESIKNALSRLARSRAGKRTKNVDGDGATGNLAVYSPLTLPPTGALFDIVNRRSLISKAVRDLSEMTNGDPPIVVVYPPTRTSIEIVGGLSPRLVYYDCSEEYRGMPGVPSDLPETERALLRRADVVSCTSSHLLDRVRVFRPDAFLCGPGVEAERFADHSGGGTGVVCYVGHLGEERVRLDVLREIVAAGLTLRVVGEARGRARRLLDLSGVDYRGKVPHERLPAALDGSDAFVLPYSINALTLGVSPAKTYECLATGRPVISSPIPAMRELKEYVYLAREPRQYVSLLRNMDRSETPEKAESRREVARRNSWDARFAEIESRISSALEES